MLVIIWEQTSLVKSSLTMLVIDIDVERRIGMKRR
jgi:hypothetical protein